jgi:hypothetical protein
MKTVSRSLVRRLIVIGTRTEKYFHLFTVSTYAVQYH